ncbi:hypothetical protein VTO42DRAFT_3636 [Malbranchea cinnamomea]
MDLNPRLQAPAHRQPSTTPASSVSGPSSIQSHLHTSHTADAASVNDRYAGGTAAAALPPTASATGAATHSNVPTNTSTDPLTDLKRPRACEACRQLKVRCDPDPNHTTGSCKRCAKANRRCVVTAPTRKRQKKADSRVAELERKIDALTASLQASRARHQAQAAVSGADTQQTPVQDGLSGRFLGMFPGRHRADSRGSNDTNEAGSSFSLAGQKTQWNGTFKHKFGNDGILSALGRERSPTRQGRSTGGQEGGLPSSVFDAVFPPPCDSKTNESTDVIDRGVVDVETATKAFDRYKNEMAPLLPFVVFPETTTMAEIRRDKPVLFLTILSVSIPVFSPSLQVPLVNEAHRVFADRILVHGQKSLELVQSLLIGCMWYMPPDHYEELKFYQFIHLAVVIGMELGMNRRAEPRSSRTLELWKEIMGRKMPYVAPDCLEARRAWLGCYFMGISASMSLRRPLLTRWNPYMEESLEVLRTSPNALPSDSALVHWIKLAHLSEEIGFQFSMDDPVTNVSFTDPKTQFALRGFERQLDEWRKGVPPEMYSPLMQHFESVVNLYMHEIAMHVDHNIDDFKPPFLTDLTEDRQTDMGTPAHVDALSVCLTSIHRVYDLLCSFEPVAMHNLPTITFVRTSYCTVALIKLYNAATASGSGLNQVFPPSAFKIEHYFDKVTQQLRAAAEVQTGRVVSKFLLIVTMLKTWFLKRKEGMRGFVHPQFALLKESGQNLPETVTSSGDLQQHTFTGGKPAPLRLLSEVALGHPNNCTSNDFQQKEHQLQTTPAVTADPSCPMDSAHTLTSNSSTVSLASALPPSRTTSLQPSEGWSQLVTQPVNTAVPYQTAPPMASSLPDYQHAYTQSQNQQFIQPAGFDMQFELLPDMQNLVADVSLLSGQADGLDLFWENMWLFNSRTTDNEGDFPP